MSASSLDPELLRAFVAVADRLSFTRAAEQLNRTQATMSMQIRRLEERIGITLFRRSTARVELTASAEDFLIDARRILALNERAIARLSHHKVAGRVRIGVMEDYGAKVLPRILAGVADLYPLVQIEMELGLTARLLKRLGSGFDTVVAMHPQNAVEGEWICTERAVWAAAPDRLTEELDPLPVALSHPDCLFRAWAIEALDAAARPWRLAYVSPSMAAVESIVAHGLAVSVLKGSMLPPGLRKVQPGPILPMLPDAAIRLHRAGALGPGAGLVVDHIERELRTRRV